MSITGAAARRFVWRGTGSETVMRSIDRIGVLCLAVALAVGLAPAATAAKKSKKSRVTTHAIVQSVGPDGVTGRVLGNRVACRAQREVTLFRVNSGPSVPSGEFVAVTWTRGDGSWTVPGPAYPGEFLAVVDAKSAKRVVCSAATSNSLHWG